MIISDYDLVKNFHWIYDKKIVLYGAGYWANNIFTVLSHLGVSVHRVLQTEKSSKKFMDCLCIETVSDVISDIDDDQYLILLAGYDCYNEMIDVLCSHNVSHALVCTIYGFTMALTVNWNYSRIPDLYRQELKEQIELGYKYNMLHWQIEQLGRIQYVRTNPGILIYQSAKVGSTSIYKSLSLIGESSMQIHSMMNLKELSPEGNEEFRSSARRKGRKLICLVRNPFHKDLSGFLQATPITFWPCLHFIGDQDYNICDGMPIYADLCMMCTTFLLYMIRSKEDEFSWFDREMKEFWGVDVYQYPFDKEAGYTVIRQDNIELLLMKTEKISILSTVIADFVGRKDFQLVSANVGGEKIYRYVYDYIKKNIVLPREYTSHYLNSKQATHFYSREELEESLQAFHVSNS